VRLRDFAEVIGRHLGGPAGSIRADDAAARFGFFSMFAGADNPTSRALTRNRSYSAGR
jgi:hypothetical protein